MHVSVAIQLPALTGTLTYALIQMVKKIALSGGACLMNVWISASLKREAIDGRPPPGGGACGSTPENSPSPDTLRNDRLIFSVVVHGRS